MINSPKMLGFRTSSTAFRTVESLCPELPLLAQVTLHVLDLDNGCIDDHPDRDGQSAQRHEVCIKPHVFHHDESEKQRKRQRENDDHGAAQTPQHEVENDYDQNRSFQQRSCNGPDAAGNDIGAVIVRDDLDARMGEYCFR